MAAEDKMSLSKELCEKYSVKWKRCVGCNNRFVSNADINILLDENVPKEFTKMVGKLLVYLNKDGKPKNNKLAGILICDKCYDRNFDIKTRKPKTKKGEGLYQMRIK